MVLKQEKVEQLLALKRRLKEKEREINRTVALRPIPGPGYEKQSRIVVVTRETDSDWWGWPLANPRCPVLQWPKFAWEEAR